MRVSLLSQQVRHHTGGRIFCFQLAVALSELGHDVTLHCDKIKPPFDGDYALYKRPKITVAHNFGHFDKSVDMYIGIPTIGAEIACGQGIRFGKPVWICIFDVLPLMKKAGRKENVPDLHQSFWDRPIRLIKDSDANVVVLADANVDAASKWLGIPKNKIAVVNPAVNDRVLAKVPDQKKRDHVIWINRILPHKQFGHALHTIRPLDVILDVVTSREEQELLHRYGVADFIDYHIKIDDEEKYTLLKRARALLFTSRYEGWGMSVAEALAVGTPVVAYPIPTLKELAIKAGNRKIYWAEDNKPVNLQRALVKCLAEEQDDWCATGFGIDSMMKQLKETILA